MTKPLRVCRTLIHPWEPPRDILIPIMFKSTLAAVAASATLFSGAAIAGPYVNIEANSGFSGSDYTQTVVDNHIGFESELGEDASWYIQGGPAIVAVDGQDATTELSGKVGLTVAAGERVDVYGEVAGITTGEIDFDEDFDLGLKLGVKIAL